MEDRLPSLEVRAEFFQATLERWLANAQSFVDEAFATDPPDKQHRLFLEPVGELVRIVQQRADGGGHTAWAFIDRRSANVFRAASYEGPEPGARGNLFDHDGGLGEVTWLGPGGLDAWASPSDPS